jgi:hypothetical protein
MTARSKSQSTPTGYHTGANNNTFDRQKKIVRWSRERDYLTSERAEQHVLIVGATGASKTSATMDLLARGVFEAGFGAFVHSAKISAATDMIKAAKAAGCKRIIYWGPGSGQRFNPWSYEYQDFGDGKGRVDNLMAVFKPLVEVMMRSSGDKESEPFWRYMNDQGFSNLFFVDGEANGSIDLSRILEMWQSLPQKWEHMEEPERFLAVAALIEAEKRCSPDKVRSLRLAKNWVNQMIGLNDRTRSCVEAMAIGMLDAHAREIMQEAMGGESTWTPEDICDGAVVVCGYDVKRYGTIGKLIQVAAKKSIQRKIERRLAEYAGREVEMRPVIFLGDEIQFFIDSGDLDFLRTSRESRGGCIWSIQSIPSVVSELGGGAPAETLAKAVFGMFQTRIYHYNECDSTNEQCARWIGQDMQRRPGGSVGIDPRGQVNRGENWSEQPYYLVPPIAFLRLARGGEAEKWNVRAIVTMAGHKWKCNDGKSWAKIKFFQNVDKAKIPKYRWPWAPIWMFLDKVPSARSWSLHVPVSQALKGFWKKHYQYAIEEHLRKPIISEWRYTWVCFKGLWVVSWNCLKRPFAFWIDDRETLLGGDHA